MTTCHRCGGTGKTPWTHVRGGVCFKCNGSGDSANPTRQPSIAVPAHITEAHNALAAEAAAILGRDVATLTCGDIEEATGRELIWF